MTTEYIINTEYKMKKKIIIFLTATIIICEILLRYSLGFCDAILYEDNPLYEYIAQANQNRIRFGNRIIINGYSQRNENPDNYKNKILGLGDSVLFGGTLIDQDSLATSIITNDTGYLMINVSCGSWGPDNCAAYIEKYGTFDAKAIVLVCSSHDAYDVMNFAPVAGVYPTYPKEQSCCAIAELFTRYIIPFIAKKITLLKYDPDQSVTNKSVKKKSVSFNDGFDKLKVISQIYNIPFMIYLHPEISEVSNKRYNIMGEEIINWCKKNEVPLMCGLDKMKSYMYNDIIHLNEKGQKQLAENLEQFIKEQNILK